MFAGRYTHRQETGSSASGGESSEARDSQHELGWVRRAALVLQLAGFIGLLAALQIVFSEGWWTDLRFQMRPVPPAVSSDLVVIALDEKYAEAHGHPDRIPTDYLARVLQAAADLEPAAVAIDVKVAPVDTSEEAYSTLLAASSGTVPFVFPSLLMQHGRGYEVALRPPEDLLAAAHTGHATFWGTGLRQSIGGLPDPSSVVIYDVPIRTRLRNGEVIPSLAARVVDLYERRRGESGPVAFQTDAVDPGQSEAINYFGRVHRDNGVAYFSSEDFIAQTRARAFRPEWIRDKLVVVGATFVEPDGFDTYRTPFGTVRGVEVHVNAVNMLMTGNHVRRLSHPVWTWLISLILFAAAVLSWHPGRERGPVWSVFYLGAYAFVALLLFFWLDVLLPMSWPLWFGALGAILGFVFRSQLAGVELPSTERMRRMLRAALTRMKRRKDKAATEATEPATREAPEKGEA